MTRVASALLVAACVLVHTATAHICMWEPMQRSAFDISTPGADPCYRKPGPCGGIPYSASGTLTKLVAGSTFQVHFQQNLNHYYVQNPGYLDVSIAYGTNNPVEGDFTPIGHPITDVNMMNMITQTNFTVPIVVPAQPCTQCVLRARYVSNNPLENDRGEIFYQCADIQIVSSDESDATEEHTAPHSSPVPTPKPTPFLPSGEPASKSAAAGCCTPRQWIAQWSETGSYRQSTLGTTYYDAVNSLMRVDTNSGGGNTIYNGAFRMYLNFSSGIEYYLNLYTNKCVPYGLDFWNDWCYGTANQSEVFQQSVTIGSTTVNIWNNGEFYFGGSGDGSCIPVLLTRPDSGMNTLYYNVAPGIPDPSVFVPPPNCHLALEEALSSGSLPSSAELHGTAMDVRHVHVHRRVAGKA